MRRQPGDHPVQPCGSCVPEAAPLHIPRWQWHCLCPVRRNRPDQMSAVCSEDPGTVWRQCSLTGMAPELRKGTVASMPDGIPVREAISAYSMEVSGRHYGGRVGAGEGDSWSYPNWDIRERLPWNGYKSLGLCCIANHGGKNRVAFAHHVLQ